MNERTFPARDAHKLEDPERLKWLPPGDVISRFGALLGVTIIDVGAGTGYFTLPLADAVGPKGEVIAVDIQGAMLEKLGAKLSLRGAPKNVRLVEGEASRTTLDGRTGDLVFMANVWHELDDVAGVLGEVKRVLRSGGRLAILDWRKDAPPPPGPPAAHRIPMDEVREVVSRHGWSVTHSENVGTYHYLLIAGA